jgi:uncharacterized protein
VRNNTRPWRPSTRSRSGGLTELEDRVLDGDVAAVRALVRQASGPNTLDMRVDRGDIEIKAKPDGTGGTRLLFTGYASVFESPYTMWDWAGDYTEIIRSGAATKTLTEDPDVVFCLNHDWAAAPMARTIAGTLRIGEDSTGLPVEADLDGQRADVYAVQSCMDAGELDAMSFAFYVTRQTWSPDYDQRDILELDIDGGDVSVVTHPANPATAGTTALRAAAARALARSRVPALLVERARAEKRAGKTLSAATTSTLTEVLDLVGSADEGLDTASSLLAELLGVDDPSDEGETDSTDSTTDVVETDSAEITAETLNSPTGPDPVAVRERLRLRAAAGR